ncbi:MAG: hypothetical protein MJD61_16640, partial [Proteobacteria bacterium]|nr:hypothetical protein [Pseudomonadota bacterium]
RRRRDQRMRVADAMHGESGGHRGPAGTMMRWEWDMQTKPVRGYDRAPTWTACAIATLHVLLGTHGCYGTSNRPPVLRPMTDSGLDAAAGADGGGGTGGRGVDAGAAGTGVAGGGGATAGRGGSDVDAGAASAL